MKIKYKSSILTRIDSFIDDESRDISYIELSSGEYCALVDELSKKDLALVHILSHSKKYRNVLIHRNPG